LGRAVGGGGVVSVVFECVELFLRDGGFDIWKELAMNPVSRKGEELPPVVVSTLPVPFVRPIVSIGEAKPDSARRLAIEMSHFKGSKNILKLSSPLRVVFTERTHQKKRKYLDISIVGAAFISTT
jgi:hypothetical protein